ncbi:MAG: hypothetical protein HUJ69_08700 [Lachnospiraceae bacterium]|nr:hypothetical protein [Lachnospiraceae bacterium]
MIKSMTGYGKAVAVLENGKLTIEIRSVNGKNADIGIAGGTEIRMEILSEGDIQGGHIVGLSLIDDLRPAVLQIRDQKAVLKIELLNAGAAEGRLPTDIQVVIRCQSTANGDLPLRSCLNGHQRQKHQKYHQQGCE